MPNRTRTVASAVVAACLANAISIAVTFSTANAGDDCRSAPKGAAADGGHWYYRTDHKTNRKCWYVADEQPAQAIPKKDPSSPLTQADAKLAPSTANAHAELVDSVPGTPPTASAAAPTSLRTQTFAPDRPLPDAQAFFNPSDRRDADASADHNVVVADDSVNVNVDPPESAARAEPAPTIVGRATAPAETQAAVTQTVPVNPLRTVLGWVLIGLGALVIAGCLVVKFTSGIRIERRDPVGT